MVECPRCKKRVELAFNYCNHCGFDIKSHDDGKIDARLIDQYDRAYGDWD